MKDTIYREAAIDALAENMPSAYTPDGSHPADEGIFMVQEVYADCIQMLKELPSAQPEIIRCNDCKWSDWYDSTDGNRYCYCMETGAAGRTADDFCSYAERRTDERFNQQTGGD